VTPINAGLSLPVAVALLLNPGCISRASSEPSIQTRSNEGARRAEESAEVSIVADPSTSVEAFDARFFTKGHKLHTLSLVNRSPLPVHHVQGTIEWRDSQGTRISLEQFSAPVEIDPGQTVTVSEPERTLVSESVPNRAKAQYELKVTHVELASPKDRSGDEYADCESGAAHCGTEPWPWLP